MSLYDKILDLKAQGKMYIIAEVGSNWKTEDDLVSAINKAKNAGADAVKFQYFTEGELYGPTYEIDKTFPLSRLKLKSDAAADIDLLCSAFSKEGVNQVDSFVAAHKVASSEMMHLRMLEVIKATGKPVILSTGAYPVADIQRVLTFLGDYPVIPMHCNVSYPTKYVDTDKFQNIKSLKPVVGYSDHTTSIDGVPLLFKSLGATVYEKHFNPLEYTDTADAPHSLNAAEFKAFVKTLRGEPVSYSEERDAKLMFMRRIVATKDILPGEQLLEGVNMGIFRVRKPDANGVSPFAITTLEGKISLKKFSAGDGISSADAQ